jgi:hypothetical protein
MADPKTDEFEPRDLIDAKSNFDPSAVGRPISGDQGGTPGGRPQPSHEEVAEQTRRQQEARSDSRPDRDDRLTNMGRGDQTHG